jgi:4-nitrophenyl phosphatase
MAPPFLKSIEEYRQLVDSVDTFLLDCDGVIYHGPVVVEGVKEVLKMFRAAGTSATSDIDDEHEVTDCPVGKKVIFVTNNASKSRRMYKSVFDKLDIEVKEVSHRRSLKGASG